MKHPPQQWLDTLRRFLLDRLRPGRNAEELRDVLFRAEAVQSDGERTMLMRLLELHETRIREIMVARSEIHDIPVRASVDEAAKALVEHGVNHLPVTDGDLDHVLGVVHTRDVLAARMQPEPPPLSSLLRPCLFASELEKVSGVLAEMKAKSCRIAMVRDEYGGIAGLVTLSDIVREVFGEIGESGQAEEAECQAMGDGEFIVLARMHIDAFREATGIAIEDGDYDTVAGWVIDSLGRIPRAGETVKIGANLIHILEADPRRIAKLRIKVEPPSSD